MGMPPKPNANVPAANSVPMMKSNKKNGGKPQ
jgi:hypothetical protein